MGQRLRVMQASVAEGTDPGLRSYSGLTGPLGRLMLRAQAALRGEKRLLSGPSTFLAAARATAVVCANAAMRRVVAKPTAGSAGIVPGGASDGSGDSGSYRRSINPCPLYCGPYRVGHRQPGADFGSRVRLRG